MKFKIWHEFMPLKIFLIVLPCLWFVSLVALPFTHENTGIRGIAICVCAGLLALMFLFMILFFVDKAIGVVIDVDDTTVKVSSLFVRRKIAIDEISDMEIEDYKRNVVREMEYRMKLTIFYGSGKRLVLTDNASEINGLMGFVTGERDILPDQDVTVYQACQYIESKMRKG